MTRRLLLLAALLTFALNARGDVAQEIVRAANDNERDCLVAAAGGATPQLLTAMVAEVDAIHRKIKPAELRAYGLYLERHAREQHATLALAKALGIIGTAYFNERQYTLGEPYDLEALEVARLSGDNETIANELLALGIYDIGSGRPYAALDRLREALERTDVPRTKALLHNSLALAERDTGNLARSIVELQEARAAFTKLGDNESIAGVTNNLGTTSLQLGDYNQAATWCEAALRIAESVKNDRIRAYALNNLGYIATKRGDLEQAQRWFEQSLALKRQLGEKPGIAVAYINIGELERQRGHRNAAFAAFLQARAIAGEVGDRAEGALAETDAAMLAVHSGTPHVALHFADRALASARGTLPSIVIPAVAARGDALRALGRRAEARAAYTEGIDIVETQRKQTGGSEQQRAQFLEIRLNPYHGMVALLALSNPAEALRYAERAKARVLLDLLRAGDDSEGKLARIAPGSAAIEFVVTHSRTYAFVVTESGVRARGIAIDERELSRQVRSLRQRIADRDHGVDAASSKLFRRLLGNVWPLIAGKKHLVVIPDGVLWELPFQALRADDGRYLAEHAAISYAPSLTALAAMRSGAAKRRNAPLSLLAFGNPPAGDGVAALPEASRQLEAIARIYGERSRIYTSGAATEQRLRDEIGDARIVQIATHGVLNGDNPLYSYLRLAATGRDDGRLEARELARLAIRSDLVVLSACDTARGTTRQGEGVIGMAWALFLAGCPSTVVSQWSVDSASTAETMIRFHQQLRGGATKSAALRAASLETMRDARFRHPFYWAAFIAIGDDSAVTR